MGFDLIIDYAHKPASLKAILQLLRSYVKGRLICLFGCGGDRDREKRPIMGQIAAQYADIVILTSDNSRSEDPEKIIGEILSGIPAAASYEQIVDRKSAIMRGLEIARPGDCLLLAGKGHEQWIEQGKSYLPFNDKEIALQLIS